MNNPPPESTDIQLRKSKTAIWVVLLVIIVSAAIAASLVPSRIPLEKYHIDKIIHFVIYGTMAFIPSYFSGSVRVAIFTGIALCLLGIGLELAQEAIPRRTGSYGDVLSNCAGILAGIIIGRLLGRSG